MPSATAEQPWRAWYSKPRWYKRAKQQLRMHPLCRMCLEKGIVVAATTADHVVPHKGNHNLFWFGELQSLCTTCHVSAKAQQERSGYRRDIDVNGWPIDPKHPFNMKG